MADYITTCSCQANQVCTICEPKPETSKSKPEHMTNQPQPLRKDCAMNQNKSHTEACTAHRTRYQGAQCTCTQLCNYSCACSKMTDALARNFLSLQAAQRRYNDMCNSGETYTEIEWLALSTHLTAVSAFVTGDKVNFLTDRAKDCQHRAESERLYQLRNKPANIELVNEICTDDRSDNDPAKIYGW